MSRCRDHVLHTNGLRIDDRNAALYTVRDGQWQRVTARWVRRQTEPVTLVVLDAAAAHATDAGGIPPGELGVEVVVDPRRADARHNRLEPVTANPGEGDNDHMTRWALQVATAKGELFSQAVSGAIARGDLRALGHLTRFANTEQLQQLAKAPEGAYEIMANRPELAAQSIAVVHGDPAEVASAAATHAAKWQRCHRDARLDLVELPPDARALIWMADNQHARPDQLAAIAGAVRAVTRTAQNPKGNALTDRWDEDGSTPVGPSRTRAERERFAGVLARSRFDDATLAALIATPTLEKSSTQVGNDGSAHRLHRSIVADVVGLRATLGPETVAAALNHPAPEVRRALIARAAAGTLSDSVGTSLPVPLQDSVLRAAAGDHDLLVRTQLAAVATPEQLAELARCPERGLRELIRKRAETEPGRYADALAVLDAQTSPVTGDMPPPAWTPTAAVTADRGFRYRPAYGTAVDDTWGHGALAARITVDAALDGDVRACLESLEQWQRRLDQDMTRTVGQRVTALADHPEPLVEFVGARAVANQIELAERVAGALSMSWKESGNIGAGRLANDWLSQRAAAVHGVDDPYGRWSSRGRTETELAERDAWRRQADELLAPVADAFLRAAHEEAGDRLRRAGFTHVPLSRGMTLTVEQAEKLGIHVQQADDIAREGIQWQARPNVGPQAPVSSWGFDDTGIGWAGAGAGRVAVVMRAMVPVDDIAGMGSAGFGGFTLDDGSMYAAEDEVLVIGRDRPCEVVAVTGGDPDLVHRLLNDAFTR